MYHIDEQELLPRTKAHVNDAGSQQRILPAAELKEKARRLTSHLVA